MMKHTSPVEETRRSLREAMPIAERCAYFDHAAVCALSRPAAEAIQKWLLEAVETGNPAWPEWVKHIETTRRDAAQLIGAAPNEIALVSNTTVGISLVAEGIDSQPGDNVVTLADEFPSNLYPWLNLESRGVETRRVATDVSGRLDLDQLANACDDRTRIVSVSWVGYATGYRHDIAQISQIAHEHGALLFVDAIQGLGAFPLDVNELGIDFLAADGHKWLLGPEGAGIAYIRGEHLDQLRPTGVGWHSVVQNDFTHIELNLKPAAARFEGGTQNSAGLIALGASLKTLIELGIDAVSAAILDITDRACERLAAAGAKIVSDRRPDHRGGQQRSGIVAFEWPGQEPMAVKRHALRQGVVFGCRAGRLRISPHAYNNEDDLDRLIDALTSSPS